MKWIIAVLLAVSIPAVYADPWCDFLSIFGMCYEDTVVKNEEAVYLSTEKIPENYQSKLKQIELSNLEDGSIIKSLGLSVSSQKSGECQIFVNDPVLKEMAITETFPCLSSQIPINKIGRDAIQNNMAYSDSLFFTVKSDGMPVDTAVSISEVIYQPPTYFAKIENGKVTQVIVAESAPDSSWVQTEKNNFAGIGYTFDNGLFLPPKQYDSWVLNGLKYEAPVPMPNDGNEYKWNEKNIAWDMVK